MSTATQLERPHPLYFDFLSHAANKMFKSEKTKLLNLKHIEGLSAKDRFYRLFKIDPIGCWRWMAAIGPWGYGSFRQSKDRCTSAHKFSYILHVGPIPKGRQIDHLCRNRWCVNPTHLELVTKKENIMRGFGCCAKNARKTHCPKGHKYDEQNTRIIKEGRYCKACSIIAKAKWMAKNKERMRAKVV